MNDQLWKLISVQAGQGPKSRFHFAHAETLGPLAAALGLFGATQNVAVNKVSPFYLLCYLAELATDFENTSPLMNAMCRRHAHCKSLC